MPAGTYAFSPVYSIASVNLSLGLYNVRVCDDGRVNKLPAGTVMAMAWPLACAAISSLPMTKPGNFEGDCVTINFGSVPESFSVFRRLSER